MTLWARSTLAAWAGGAGARAALGTQRIRGDHMSHAHWRASIALLGRDAWQPIRRRVQVGCASDARRMAARVAGLGPARYFSSRGLLLLLLLFHGYLEGSFSSFELFWDLGFLGDIHQRFIYLSSTTFEFLGGF